ncbi:MAG: heme ABC transporter ATP-binding protein [Varibaculum sp.]|nr:heme ABC transporter ATP-binding protein [Varibaculum sp.]
MSTQPKIEDYVPALSAQGLAFSYGEKTVLRDVSLTVSGGEVLGLLGPNGTGKSTLLSLLVGDRRADSGEIKVFGRALGEYSRRELAQVRAVMPQSAVFPFAYLVRDIVAMGRTPWGSTPQEDAEIIDSALQVTETTGLQDRDVTTLSGGEQSRVTFARTIAQQSRIVFLDEPTAALDIAHQERIMEICRDLAQQGCAVVVVLHDISLAAAYCDRVLLLTAGALAGEETLTGSPAEVLTGETLSSVYDWQIQVIDVAGHPQIVPVRK